MSRIITGRIAGPDRARSELLEVLARLGLTEEGYRAVVEGLPVVTYLDSLDGQDRTLFISSGVEEMLGIPVSVWTTEPGVWLRHIHPQERPRVESAQKEADRDSSPFDEIYRMVRPDGGIRWIHEQAVVVRDASDEPVCWQGYFRDVTAQREAEEQVAQVERRYRLVVEHSPAALYMEDLDPSWVGTDFVSPQVEAITGYPPQEWIDDPDLWLKITHPDDLPAVLEMERRCVDTGEPFAMDVRIVRTDGSVVWIHDRAVLVRDDEGEPMFWLGFFHDVTAKKQAEQELAWALQLEHEALERMQAVDEMKNVFLTAASHELRSPLAAILGSARTLETVGEGLSREDHDALVGGISRKAARLAELVDDLLDLERVRQGVATIRRTPGDLAAIVREAIDASGLRSSMGVVEDLPSITAAVDRGMVARIIDNLLSNVKHYATGASEVTIRLRPLDGGAELIVEDDGPGVPAELWTAIFDPFRQGESGASGHGVGVGLALVARFAQLHGGRAWVEERRGGGASFHVLLPGG